MVETLFEDIFRVDQLDPDGKKFDKVNRVAARSDQFDMYMQLDVNTDIYPMHVGEKFMMVLATTLNLDGTPDSGFFSPGGRKSLADKFEYVMHGKLYRISEEGSGNNVKADIYVSFGGLLMLLRGDPSIAAKFELDQRLFILMRKAWNAQKAGAAAILVADDRPEPLITMDTPEEGNAGSNYLQNISIPSALVSQSLGEAIKKALRKPEMVKVNLDWREALPHPDDRVEYEFWTNSNDECGRKCDSQKQFVKDFKGVAQILEKKGYTQFTPHYITWYCPEAFILSKQCKSQCINHGRYCAPDPEEDFSRGYDGKDVVVQNLRQACFYKVANESGKPWLWWDYVTDFAIRCPMKEERYTKECAEDVIASLGVDVKKIRECVGDTEADVENPVLKAEQEAQIGKGNRGDVTILPTLIVNGRQFRGKLDKGTVLKAICSGFEETTEPVICLRDGIETNECMENNGGCWIDKSSNITACRDTFRGRVCQCPIVQGVKFFGDGYTKCEASGALRCGLNNGGCWKDSQQGSTYSACIDNHTKGCECPPGFKGDGVKICEDIDECEEKTACQCPDCKCKNTWGSYECQCGGDLLYIREHDICISKDATSGVGWGFLSFIILGLAVAGTVGYAFYKYRIRTYMDSEIRAIMAQYMPLDNQAELAVHGSQGNV